MAGTICFPGLTMSNTHPSNQFGNGLLIKDIANHTVGFALKESAFWATSHDATRILSPVLKQRKTFTYVWCRVH
jgi:hypothetical protein